MDCFVGTNEILIILAVLEQLSLLDRLDEVQEELLYYPLLALALALAAAAALAKSLMLKFLCDGQGAVRLAILSL